MPDDGTIRDIMALAPLAGETRRRQLSYIVGGHADAVGVLLSLEPKQAESAIRALLGAAKARSKVQYDLKPDRWFTQSQLAGLRDACETPQEYAMIATGYWCGLRAVEYTLLQWQDVRRPHLLRATRVKRSRWVSHDIVLDRGTWSALHEWRNRREGFDRDSQWVFPGQDGQQACARTILRRFQRIAERCRPSDPGEYKWRRIHALRHTVAVHMLEGGVGLPDIQTRLGHSSPASTQIYAQMTTPRKMRISRRMTMSGSVVEF